MQYQHRSHPRAKHLKLSVEAGGQVVVTSPPHTSIKQIDKFVQAKQAWIQQQQHKMRQHSFRPVTNDYVWLFGQKLTLKRQTTTRQHTKIDKQPGQLVLKVPSPLINNQEKIKTKLNDYLKKTARAYLQPRTQHLSQKLGVSYQRLFLRQQKTRWGSCSGKNNLNFNWRLVHFETAVIDYVIIHELAHLKHRNHSPKFWQVVTQFDPEQQIHRHWLKKHLIVVD